jgi:hypothetical protein
VVRALGSVLAAVAELGTRVLRSLERSLYPDLESELVDGDDSGYVYGITKPAAGDKMFVDPLREWDVCSVNYYLDSFGRRVYPQLSTDGTRAGVYAAEYRELSEDEGDDPNEDESLLCEVGGNSGSDVTYDGHLDDSGDSDKHFRWPKASGSNPEAPSSRRPPSFPPLS